MKKVIFSLLIIVVIYSAVNYVSDIIVFKQHSNNSKKQFYSENIDYDVIFLGLSTVHYGISPLYLFSNYGLSSYNLSAPGCHYDDLYAISLDAIQNKKTKIFIVDYLSLMYVGKNAVYSIGNISSVHNPYTRFITYYKDDNLSKSLQNTNLYYLFHNRWKNISENDFYTQGYLRGYSSSANVSKNSISSSDKVFELSDIQKKQIDDYISLLEKNNVKLILTAMPTMYNHTIYSEAAVNSIKDYIAKYDIEFISLKNLDIYNIEKDFQSPVHLNFQGGKKLMNRQDFIPYIMEKYNLKDHRQEKEYAQWYKDYEKQERMINGKEVKISNNIQSWWQYSNYDNYTMLISSNGDNVLNRLPQDIKDKFTSSGLNKFDTDKTNQKYAAIIDDGKVFYEEVSDKKAEYKGRMKNIVNLLVSSENKKATINVSGKPRAKNKYGINFVIYDKVNREIVDSIWLDPSDFNKIRR